LYYSGPTAAWAYKHLSKDAGIERVFLFGPSHHKYFPGCTLTYADEFNTPMGPIQVDIDSNLLFNVVVDELKKEEGFHMIDIDD
jgi:AmmeMemoRadiSam system protein B